MTENKQTNKVMGENEDSQIQSESETIASATDNRGKWYVVWDNFTEIVTLESTKVK